MVRRTSNLNLSNNLTKSRHGGKRAGAGRPRSEYSIAQALEEQAAMLLANPHPSGETYTRWELASNEYIHNHAIRLVVLLRCFEDLSRGKAISKKIFLLGRNQAYRIAHADEDEQREILKRDYRHVLLKAIEQYGAKYGNIVPTEDGKWSERAGAYLIKECERLLAEAS